MAKLDPSGGSRPPQRRRWSRAWTCGALAAVPLLAFAIGAVAVHAAVPASHIAVGFQPSMGLAGIGLVCAALHAAWFGRQLERLRRDKGGVIGDRVRPARAISSPAQVVLAAAIVGGFVFGFVAYQVGDLMNAALDQSEWALAYVDAKEHALSGRCEWRLRASGRDVAAGTSICVDQALWERVAVGNQLAVVKVRSEFGTQIQWAPETPAPGSGGRHD
ncbi:MAG: hypothetical protein ACJ8IK_16460 [Burkholderiaceae bacterium]